MGPHEPGLVRAVALVGPTGAGKTTLMESMLAVAGARAPRTGGGGTVGDTSPEARARGHSGELNVGAVDFAAESDLALPAVDLAVVVAEPDPAKAVLLQPLLRALEQLGVPRLLF